MCGRSRSQIECLFQSFVTLSKDFLRHVCKIADLTKCPWNMRLSTGNKYTGCNDSIEGLPTKQFFFIRAFVELLRNIADGLGERELITPTRDITEGSKEVALRT